MLVGLKHLRYRRQTQPTSTQLAPVQLHGRWYVSLEVLVYVFRDCIGLFPEDTPLRLRMLRARCGV